MTLTLLPSAKAEKYPFRMFSAELSLEARMVSPFARASAPSWRESGVTA